MNKTVFLDTNVFLHYQPFDQIDWVGLLKAETVTIVIPPVTIRELNKHKELHLRKHIRSRANMIIKRLLTFFELGTSDGLSEKVKIKFEDRDPVIDYVKYQLNKEIQDDNLIASIIMYITNMPDAKVVLVTSDTGLTLLTKASRQGIEAYKIPDQYKIAETPDLDEQKIHRLEQEVTQLKSRIPSLSLIFDNGDRYGKFLLSHPLVLDPIEVDKKLGEIKNKYPKKEYKSPLDESAYNDSTKELMRLASTLAMDAIPPEEIDRYNSDLDRFYASYSRYFESVVSHENRYRRTIELRIALVNDGSVPAEDIDVFLFFPDGFELLEEHNLVGPPVEPSLPSKLRTRNQMMFNPAMLRPEISAGLLNSFVDINSTVVPSNVSAPSIKRVDSYEVNVHIQKVKHNLQELCEPLYVIFDSYDKASSFEIKYKILAANIPHEVSGVLNVIVQKTE